MNILAIDPGQYKSAYVLYEDKEKTIISMGIVNNKELLFIITGMDFGYLAIEMIQPYGQRVGKSVFETALWIGRFIQQAVPIVCGDKNIALLYKKIRWQFNGKEYLPINKWLCGNSNVKDADIRNALIDRFGDKGTKDDPGKLYGVKKDIWSALAVAITFSEQVLGT